MTTPGLTSEPISRRMFAGASIFFWALALFLLLWGLGLRQLWTAENRWAEITRNMIHSRDYFHPRINGEPYFDKPLGGYWMIAIAAKLLGGLNEWTIRLPSAIAGLVALWATINLGRRLFCDEGGRIAGWVLLGCYGFVFWARTGQSDMENLAFTMAAIAWYWARRNSAGFWTSFVFYVICFVGAQMKGLGAIAVPCIAVFPDLFRDKRWKHFLTLSHLAALVLASAFYFAPFIIESLTRGSYGEGGLQLVFRENVQRFFDPFDHKEPFYVYLYYLPVNFMPWAPLLVIAVFVAAKQGRELLKCDYPSRWLMEASLLVFLFFTASGSRRGYYIIPLMPFCALLSARFLLSSNHAKERRTALDIQKMIVFVTAICVLAACVLWPIVNRHVAIPIPTGFILAMATTSLLAIAALRMNHWRPALIAKIAGTSSERATVLVSTAILMGGYICAAHVSLDSLRTTRQFVESLHKTEGNPKETAFYQVMPTEVATVVYYLGGDKPLHVLQTPDEVVGFLRASPGVNGVLITRSSLQNLSARLPSGFTLAEAAAEPCPHWEGSSGKSKKWVLVRAATKPADASMPVQVNSAGVGGGP